MSLWKWKEIQEMLRSSLNYSVIGTGAIGGYYGARLQESGKELHYLLHSDFEHTQKNGLRVQSVDGDIQLPKVYAYQTAGEMPSCDVVIVALKSTQNKVLPQILPHVVHENSTVLLLQNGLGGEELIRSILPHHRIISGLCFICSSKIGPGYIHHQDYGPIRLGIFNTAPNNGDKELLEQISKDLQHSKIKIHTTDNLLKARWMKLVWNIPFNGLSVILKKNTLEILEDEEHRSLTKKLMDETILGARACGYDIDPSFADQMIEDTLKMKPYLPSMRLDHDNQRPLEIEAIYDFPVQQAKQNGYIMSNARLLSNQLKALNTY